MTRARRENGRESFIVSGRRYYVNFETGILRTPWHKYDPVPKGIHNVKTLAKWVMRTYTPPDADCTHPDAVLVADEKGVNCKGRAYTRERWNCPACGATWFEAVRWTD